METNKKETKKSSRSMRAMDGNQAAALAAYAYSDVTAIYPITPSSSMAEWMDEWAARGEKNLFGQSVHVAEMQSEAGAAGAVHGALAAGALTTTFTASQGLLLMIPNLYKIAGEGLPGVFHVAARTIASHALSIFGDHSDIYACRQTGVAMLASSSVQEVMDLAPVAHAAALASGTPFLHFFDGFRTSHEIQKIEAWNREDYEALLDREAVVRFQQQALNPMHARQMGSAQNADVFFQYREAANPRYDRIPEIVEGLFRQIGEMTGRAYGLFQYYGSPEAEHIIIAMGSVCQTIEETIDEENAQGKKTGLVKVRLYRPFEREKLLAVIPKTTDLITVLDRTKEPGSIGEPLYLDVLGALQGSYFQDIPVFSGRYGLSSKDTTPAQIHAVFANRTKKRFTIGIEDDVTHLSLPIEEFRIEKQGEVCCKFWGLGGDGTVGGNKSSVKIIGNHTDLYAQAYFDYDSKKSRGLTVSHLRFGPSPIRSAYLIDRADFVACHNYVYMHKFNIVQELRDGGTFLLNCPYEGEALERFLPGQVKRYLAEHKIRFFVIDGLRIGKEIGLNDKINTILQAAFFKLSGIISPEKAIVLMKESAKAAYERKGEKIVQMNYAAIERGMEEVREVTVPDAWRQAKEEPLDTKLLPDREEVLRFVERIQKPVAIQEGDRLPVSAFVEIADGSVPSGTAAHERRNVATEIPVWKPENCIQCNRCSYVCPHAVIRPAVMNEEERKNAPEGMEMLPVTGAEDYHVSMVISGTDCTGCGSCAAVCPGKQGEKALVMCPVHEHEERQQYFDYGKGLPEKDELVRKFGISTVKGSQYKKPYLEFHGACAGCGETSYARLVTQLFGDRMYIANATGCSSIWGNSYPSTPYTADQKGRGPAWSNSLFEDAAEFGYGMLLAEETVRERLRGKVETLWQKAEDETLRTSCDRWLSTYDDFYANKGASEELIRILTAQAGSTEQESGGIQERSMGQECSMEQECSGQIDGVMREILQEQNFLPAKSKWVFGGDGWAYDIGFGGLDHVLASGRNINMLVFDTEVYSNTGGQASKATPLGSTALFAAGGKRTVKKDLAGMMISYGYIYVAQIAMGADYNQTVKALTEAAAYNGPSIVIAYAPCINHGIRAGMGSVQHEEERAVRCGYFTLLRYNPALIAEGKNPFSLDSREPSLPYREFLGGEIRYTALEKTKPEEAERLFAQAQENAERRYASLKQLAEMYAKRYDK